MENPVHPDAPQEPGIGDGLFALDGLVDNLPGMVYRCHLEDNRQQMLYVSRGSQALTGYPADALLEGRPTTYWHLINPDDWQTANAEMAAALAEKRTYRCTYRLTTADGRERWVLDMGRARPAADGTGVVCEGFVSDRTEHLQLFQRLERQAAQRLRRLDALYDILQVAADSSGLEATLNRTLERTLKAVEATAGAIHLLEQSDALLKLAAKQGLSTEVSEKLGRITVEGEPLWGWIVNQRQRLQIHRADEDPRTAALAMDAKAKSYLGVPIVASERLLGVLSLFFRALPHHTAGDDIELVESVAEEIGIVVENAYLRQRAEKLMVMEERNRLARELHDSVTQSLYGVTLFAEAGRNLAQAGELAAASELFDELLGTGQQALKEMRLLVHKLRPSVLEKVGLVKALQHRLSAVEGRAGVKSQLKVEDGLDLAADLEEALYHISQEALNNAIKHAAASHVEVRLWQNEQGEIELIVSDNGHGFDPETAVQAGGLGLTSIQERAARLGGRCELQSSPGTGTQVHVCLPRPD